jgi:hypothetical protein
MVKCRRVLPSSELQGGGACFDCSVPAVGGMLLLAIIIHHSLLLRVSSKSGRTHTRDTHEREGGKTTPKPYVMVCFTSSSWQQMHDSADNACASADAWHCS